MKVESLGDIYVIKLEGVINVQMSLDFEAWLSSFFLEKNPKKVIVDLSQVQHISSSGLRVLVSFYKKLLSVQGKLVLVGLNQNLKKIFKIVELDTVFETYDSIEEAKTKF